MTPMWEPATDIEQRLRDALRAKRQEEYFRLLTRVDLLLPVHDGQISGAGSWATWSTEERTHILAFTSPEAMQACLHSHAGSFRTVQFTRLADEWPDPAWWLAVNPGLPIEGYLPSWFVGQVANGNAVLPEAEPEPSPPQSAPAPGPDSRYEQPRQGATAASTPGGLPSRDPGTNYWDSATPDYAPPTSDRQQPAQPAQPARSVEQPAPQRDSGLPTRDPNQKYWTPNVAAPEPEEDPHDYWDDDSYDPNEELWTPDFSKGAANTRQELPSRTKRTEREAPEPAPFAQDPPESAPPAQDPPSFSEPVAESTPQPQAPEAAASSLPAAEVPRPAEWLDEDQVEDELARAASEANSAAFLETLMCSWAYVPIPFGSSKKAVPGESEFGWYTDVIEGEYTVTAFTTSVRLTARYGDMPYVKTTFARLAKEWPGVEYSLYVNPGTEVGANMPGPQVTTFVKWADAKGLLSTALDLEDKVRAQLRADQAVVPQLMQKVLPHHQVSMILDRGYDRVAGFVHCYADVADLATPRDLYAGLRLVHRDSPFSYDDTSVHVVSWVGHRRDLYQQAYGGNDSRQATENGGWVVEPPPFVGDGYTDGENGRRVPEYKVDSVRLPHGARIYRLGADGSSTEVASYDADRREWLEPAPVRSSEYAYHGYGQEQQHA
ncbi:MAG TPA: hypothetical protein H9902_08670 [Candidatus Stackebrandtia faecavium]|nr:hypothetical protein [Candidatus Stackebrandtia faecavium]